MAKYVYPPINFDNVIMLNIYGKDCKKKVLKGQIIWLLCSQEVLAFTANDICCPLVHEYDKSFREKRGNVKRCSSVMWVFLVNKKWNT